MRYLIILVVFALMSYSVMASSTHITTYWTGNWTNLSYASDNNYNTYAASTYLFPTNKSSKLYANYTIPSYAINPILSFKYANYGASNGMILYLYNHLTQSYVFSNGMPTIDTYPNTSIYNRSVASYLNDDNFGSFYVFSSTGAWHWYFEGVINWIDSRLDNCSNTSDEAIVFDIYSESSPSTHLISQFQITGSYYLEIPNSTPRVFNFSYMMNGSNQYRLCYSDEDYPVRVSAYLQNIYISGFTHRFYVMNESVSGSPLNISLYNFADTTDVSDLKITVRDKLTYQYLDNIYVLLQRRYIGEGVWRTVQMDMTDDYGLIHFNVLEESTDYKLIFMDSDKNILQTSESMKFICSSGLCEIVYLIDPSPDTNTDNDLTITSAYGNTTGEVAIFWDDPSGRATAISISLSKETLTGTTYICEAELAASNGIYVCNASGYTGPLYLRVSSTTNGIFNPEYSAFIETSSAGISGYLDQSEGALWTVGLIMVIGGIGFYSPVGVVLSSLFALIVSYAFGLISAFTITGITIALVIGIVIAVKVKQ